MANNQNIKKSTGALGSYGDSKGVSGSVSGVVTQQEAAAKSRLRSNDWYVGEKPTAAQYLAATAIRSENDPIMREAVYQGIGQEMQTKGTELYDPSRFATSQYMGYLKNLGIDTSKGIDDNFFNQNAGYQKYLKASDSTGSPTKPSSKTGTDDEWRAYYLYQLKQDYDYTKKAQSEIDNMYKSVSYYVGRGYSDDEIRRLVGNDFNSTNKYGTLNSMYSKAKTGVAMPTTAAVGYNDDTITGMIWSARNGGSETNWNNAAVNYYLGQGKYDRATDADKARRKVGSSTWHPYVDGSNMDDACMLFGVKEFSHEWEEQNMHLLNDGTPEEQKAFKAVHNALATADKAQQELDILKQMAYTKLEDIKDANSDGVIDETDIRARATAVIENQLADKETYGTLVAMDQGREKLNPVNLAYGVDYRKEDIIDEMVAEYSAKIRAGDYTPKAGFNAGVDVVSGADPTLGDSYERAVPVQSTRPAATTPVTDASAGTTPPRQETAPGAEQPAPAVQAPASGVNGYANDIQWSMWNGLVNMFKTNSEDRLPENDSKNPIYIENPKIAKRKTKKFVKEASDAVADGSLDLNDPDAVMAFIAGTPNAQPAVDTALAAAAEEVAAGVDNPAIGGQSMLDAGRERLGGMDAPITGENTPAIKRSGKKYYATKLPASEQEEAPVAEEQSGEPVETTPAINRKGQNYFATRLDGLQDRLSEEAQKLDEEQKQKAVQKAYIAMIDQLHESIQKGLPRYQANQMLDGMDDTDKYSTYYGAVMDYFDLTKGMDKTNAAILDQLYDDPGMKAVLDMMNGNTAFTEGEDPEHDAEWQLIGSKYGSDARSAVIALSYPDISPADQTKLTAQFVATLALGKPDDIAQVSQEIVSKVGELEQQSRDARAAAEVEHSKYLANQAMSILQKTSADGYDSLTDEEKAAYEKFTSWNSDDLAAFGYGDGIGEELYNAALANEEYFKYLSRAAEFYMPDYKIAQYAGISLEDFYEQTGNKLDPLDALKMAEKTYEEKWSEDSLTDEEKEGIGLLRAVSYGVDVGWTDFKAGNVGFVAALLDQGEDWGVGAHNQQYFRKKFGFSNAQNEYLRAVRFEINNMVDQEEKKRWMEKYNTAVTNGGNIFNTLPMYFEQQHWENTFQEMQQYTNEIRGVVAKEGTGLENTLFDLTSTTTTSLAQTTEQIALTTIGGMIGVPAAGTMASLVTYLPATTNSVYRDLKDVVGKQKAFQVGLGVGAINAVMESEMMENVYDFSSPTNTALNDALQGLLAKDIDKNGAKSASQWLKRLGIQLGIGAAKIGVTGTFEGVQEVAEDLIEGGVKTAVTGDERYLQDAKDNAGKTFLYSFASSPFIGLENYMAGKIGSATQIRQAEQSYLQSSLEGTDWSDPRGGVPQDIYNSPAPTYTGLQADVAEYAAIGDEVFTNPPTENSLVGKTNTAPLSLGQRTSLQDAVAESMGIDDGLGQEEQADTYQPRHDTGEEAQGNEEYQPRHGREDESPKPKKPMTLEERKAAMAAQEAADKQRVAVIADLGRDDATLQAVKQAATEKRVADAVSSGALQNEETQRLADEKKKAGSELEKRQEEHAQVEVQFAAASSRMDEIRANLQAGGAFTGDVVNEFNALAGRLNTLRDSMTASMRAVQEAEQAYSDASDALDREYSDMYANLKRDIYESTSQQLDDIVAAAQAMLAQDAQQQSGEEAGQMRGEEQIGEETVPAEMAEGVEQDGELDTSSLDDAIEDQYLDDERFAIQNEMNDGTTPESPAVQEDESAPDEETTGQTGTQATGTEQNPVVAQTDGATPSAVSMTEAGSGTQTPVAAAQIGSDGTVPTVDQNGKPLGQFVTKQAPKSTLHPETLNYLYNNGGYDRDTNKAQLERASAMIEQLGGARQATDHITKIAASKANYELLTADNQAMFSLLMADAVARNDIDAQKSLASAYNSLGTMLGQGLQARVAFRMLQPGVALDLLQNELDKVQQKYGKLVKKGEQIGVSEDMKEAILEARTAEERQNLIDKVLEENAAKLKASPTDIMNTWRYLSMLGNPKTHMRNMAGNASMALMAAMRNRVSAAIQNSSGFENRFGDTAKTRSNHVSSEHYAQAKTIYQRIGKDMLENDGRYSKGIMSKIEEMRDKAGWLKPLSDLNSDFLGKEDMFFKSAYFKNSLAAYLAANDIDVDMSMSDEKLMKDPKVLAAVEHAYKDALTNTFNNLNKFTAWYSNAIANNENVPKWVGGVINSQIPFMNVPANVIARGIDYSPAGLLRSIIHDGKLVQEGKITPSEWADRRAAGLTGTALTALGFFLSSVGAITGSLGSDDKDKYDKSKGKQAFSVNLPGGYSFTLDFGGPATIALMLGASLHDESYDLFENGGFEGMTYEQMVHKVANTMFNMFDPMTEMTMLQNIGDLISTDGTYNDENLLVNKVQGAAFGYISQYFPTVLSQIGRFTNGYDEGIGIGTRQGTQVEDPKIKGISKGLQYQLNKLGNRIYIPVLSEYLNKNGVIDKSFYVDRYGHYNTATDSAGEWLKFFDTFILPGYVGKSVSNAATDFIDDALLRSNGDAGVILSDMPTTYTSSSYIPVEDANKAGLFTYKNSQGSTVYAMKKEYQEQAQRTYGENAVKAYAEVSKLDGYANGNLGAGYIKEITSYIEKEATKAAFFGSPFDPATVASDALASAYKKQDAAIKKDYVESATLLADGYDMDSLTAAESIAYYQSLGKDEQSNFRSSLTTKIKPIYVDAYKKGDQKKMYDIAYTLQDKYGYKYSTINGWIKE